MKKNWLLILGFVVILFLLFWQILLKNSYPYPGNYQMAWFEPWKSDHFSNGVITIHISLSWKMHFVLYTPSVS